MNWSTSPFHGVEWRSWHGPCLTFFLQQWRHRRSEAIMFSTQNQLISRPGLSLRMGRYASITFVCLVVQRRLAFAGNGLERSFSTQIESKDLSKSTWIAWILGISRFGLESGFATDPSGNPMWEQLKKRPWANVHLSDCLAGVSLLLCT